MNKNIVLLDSFIDRYVSLCDEHGDLYFQKEPGFDSEVADLRRKAIYVEMKILDKKISELLETMIKEVDVPPKQDIMI